MDESAWRRFREHVFAKYGTLRKLSDEVEALICSEDTEGTLMLGAKKIGVKVDRAMSPSQIKRIRPKLRGASAETIVRRMRTERSDGRLSRH